MACWAEETMDVIGMLSSRRWKRLGRMLPVHREPCQACRNLLVEDLVITI